MQAFDFYWLGQVFVEAGGEGTLFVGFLAVTGQRHEHHGFCVREHPDATRDLVAVDARKPDIHQRDVE